MKSDGYLDDKKLKTEILRHIEQRKYRLTKHAAEEQANDKIDLEDTLHILRSGFHEKNKTTFNNVFQNWNYAIRGKRRIQKSLELSYHFQRK